MSRLWYYRRDGQTCGPVTPVDLKMLADSGALQRTDQVCKAGSVKWIPARVVRGLFDGGDESVSLVKEVQEWGKVALISAALIVLAALMAGISILVFRPSDTHPTAPIVAQTAPAPPPPTVTTPAPTAPPKHLLAALHEMREARTELRGAGHTFGGHLEQASHALEQATEQTEHALRAAGVDTHTDAPHPDTYQKYPDLPHLRHPLDQILEARAELKIADRDFGGERDRTLQVLSEAAEQVELALPFARGSAGPAALPGRPDGRDPRPPLTIPPPPGIGECP